MKLLLRILKFNRGFRCLVICLSSVCRVERGTGQLNYRREDLYHVRPYMMAKCVHEASELGFWRFPTVSDSFRRFSKVFDDFRRFPLVSDYLRRFPTISDGFLRFPTFSDGLIPTISGKVTLEDAFRNDPLIDFCPSPSHKSSVCEMKMEILGSVSERSQEKTLAINQVDS